MGQERKRAVGPSVRIDQRKSYIGRGVAGMSKRVVRGISAYSEKQTVALPISHFDIRGCCSIDTPPARFLLFAID